MGKFDGVLLCSDFDGTLYYNNTISDENCEAIRYFQANGGLFTMASGRSPSYFKELSSLFIPNTYVIGLNGAAIYNLESEELLFTGYMPEHAYSFAAEVFTHNPDIRIVGFHTFDACHSFEKGSFDPAFRLEVLAKLIFLVDAENSDRIKTSVDALTLPAGFNVSRSSIRAIEVLRTDSTKGSSVRRLASKLGDRVDLVVCVGDYENDIDMIKTADIGYAVENASDSLKAVADRITVPYNEHAIAKIISEL